MPRPEKRVVSLLPSATEIAYGIGLQNQIVGISHECNWPPGVENKPRVTRSNVDSSASSGQIDQQVQTLLKAGRALYEIEVELLVSLAPEVIITQAQCDVCAISYETVLGVVKSNPALRDAQVIALNPASLDEVLSDILRIGQATDATDSAQQYREQLQQRIAAASNCRTVGQRAPKTLVIEWTDPLMVAGNWSPELVELAGGQYGLAKAGDPSPCVVWDDVVRFDPEVLIVAPCGFNLERSQQELEKMTKLPAWGELPAVRDGRVFAVDGDAYFNRPGPRLVDSLEMLATWVS